MADPALLVRGIHVIRDHEVLDPTVLIDLQHQLENPSFGIKTKEAVIARAPLRQAHPPDLVGKHPALDQLSNRYWAALAVGTFAAALTSLLDRLIGPIARMQQDQGTLPPGTITRIRRVR